MLFRCTPVPGTTTPEHEPFEHVTEHAQPSRSSTAMCVVEPSRPAAGQEPLARTRGRPAPRGTPGCARAGCAPSPRRSARRRRSGAAAFGVEHRQRARDQDPPGRGRRVGQHLAPAVRAPAPARGRPPRRRARSAAVSSPAAGRSPSRRSPPRCRRCRTAPPPRPQAARARRRARAGGPRSPAPQHAALGREQRGALGRGGDDPGEDLDHVRLLRVELHAVTRQRAAGVDQLVQRHPPEPRRRPRTARRASRTRRPTRRRC